MLDKLRKHFKTVYEKLSKTDLKGRKLEEASEDFKITLLTNDVAIEVADKISKNVTSYLCDVKVPRTADKRKVVKEAFFHVLNEVFQDVKSLDLEKLVIDRVKKGEITTLVFSNVV